MNVNGVLALVTVVPLVASVFAFRRYRDAVGAQRELTHLSLHDAMTRLPNRRHLWEVLPDAFMPARRTNSRAAVMSVDLDGFKAFNDTYGHEVGDPLMVAVADRLRHAAEPDRWVFRYGGDEFVLVDPSATTAEHALRIAGDLVDLLEVPFQLGEDRTSISASIGVAFGDVDSDPETAVAADLRAAWTTLSEVRSQGVGLVLDDFGGASTSLNLLCDFDLELLQLDRSLAAAIGERAGTEQIVWHVLSLAKSLGIATLAVGLRSWPGRPDSPTSAASPVRDTTCRNRNRRRSSTASSNRRTPRTGRHRPSRPSMSRRRWCWRACAGR